MSQLTYELSPICEFIKFGFKIQCVIIGNTIQMSN